MIASIAIYDKSAAPRSASTRWIGLANVSPPPRRPPVSLPANRSATACIRLLTMSAPLSPPSLNGCAPMPESEWLFYALRGMARTLRWWFDTGYLPIKGAK